MHCRRCGHKAHIDIRRHNTAFCNDCFLHYFERQVKRAVESQKMFAPDERVLVAVSGGKDSLSLWDTLLRLGYTTSGLYIDLGIGGYSAESRQRVAAFASEKSAPLFVFDVAKELGMGIEKLSRRTSRTACSACGLVKRYVFNWVAAQNGFTVVATAHNLDDEAATLLSNVLRWQSGYLARQAPVLLSTHPKLVKKVKPLYRVAEREAAAYAILRGIDYVVDECPLSEDTRSLHLKRALNELELLSPATKQSFYLAFLERIRPIFHAEDRVDLRECALCGQPTTEAICAFCRLLGEVRGSS